MPVLLAWLVACGTPAPEAPSTAPVGPEPVAAPADDGTRRPAPSREARQEATKRPTASLDVRTTSFPADWLVRAIGGEQVEVTRILPAGEDAPFHQPDPEVIASLADADLIVANGAGFEAWMATATLPAGKVLETAGGVDLIEREAVTHSHGADGEHSHAGIDPHTWSDPLAYLQQAKAVHSRLVFLDATHAETYDAGYAQVQQDLTALHEAWAEAWLPAAGRRFAASHPAFEYLARRYEVNLTSFDLDPEAPATPAQAAAVSAWAKAAGPEAVFLWEARPTPEAMTSLPNGLVHVVLDPLEQPGADGRYDPVKQARSNVHKIRRVLGLEPAPEADGAPPR